MGKSKVWEQNKAWLEEHFGKVTTEETSPNKFQSKFGSDVQASDGDFEYELKGLPAPTVERSIQNLFRYVTTPGDYYILRNPPVGTPKRFTIAPKTHEKISLDA